MLSQSSKRYSWDKIGGRSRAQHLTPPTRGSINFFPLKFLGCILFLFHPRGENDPWAHRVYQMPIPSKFLHAYFQKLPGTHREQNENYSPFLQKLALLGQPPGINSLQNNIILGCWQRGDERTRGWNATSNNMAGLAGSQPTHSPIDQTDIHRAAERKGSRPARPHSPMLLAIQATAAHWVMLPWAVSWGSAVPHPH